MLVPLSVCARAPLPPQVSATFAASLVTSPAIGAYLSAQYGDSLVALVATVISVADIAFVFFVVPESLPDKMRLTSWGFPISWQQADPFAVSSDPSRLCFHGNCRCYVSGLSPVHGALQDQTVSGDLIGSGGSRDPRIRKVAF